jgi:hypothetical protein
MGAKARGKRASWLAGDVQTVCPISKGRVFNSVCAQHYSAAMIEGRSFTDGWQIHGG